MKSINPTRIFLVIVLALTATLLYRSWLPADVQPKVVPAAAQPIATTDRLLLCGVLVFASVSLFSVKKTNAKSQDLNTSERAIFENTIEKTMGEQSGQVLAEADTINTPDTKNPGHQQSMEAMETYVQEFHKRYKTFYADIQSIPVEADESQARDIRRQLVEMALHAFSFAKAARYGKLHRSHDEPNVRLIMEDIDIAGLEKTDYRTYTDDPYQTEKRYHILRKIFQDMDLQRLDVLAETVHISPEFLTKP